MRPQVRGLRMMPSRLSAAWTRHAPSSGFCCNSLTVAMARRSTLRGPSLRACDLSSSPATPSATQRCKVR